MRIGLDLRMIGGGSGLDRYITELFHEILKQDKVNEYVLFFRSKGLTGDFKEYKQKIVIVDISHYSFAEQLRLPFILMQEKLDLIHFPHFNVPFLYRKKFVVTIHDLTHTLIPGKKKSHVIHRFAYNLVFWNAIRSAHQIIAVSQATKKAILDYFHINSDRIKLVLAGKKDPFYPEIEEKVFSIKNKSRIKALGRISEAELKAVYNGATLFVLPSHMEGFGLTVLEAAACGVPIACSDIPSLREIAGQAAEYFDPYNLQNMTDVLKNLINKPERLEELANLALSRSKHFSWRSAAVETMEVYK